MATDAEGKKLSDLRVVDLRAELEKRGLDKTGVKAALLERLQKALLSEGKDPDEYEFELNDKKPVKRLSTSNRTEEVDNSTETSANDSNVLMIETPSLEQEADKDGGHEEETKNSIKGQVDNKNDIVNAESPLNISIGEEEEELLNSGDEHDQSANSLQKDEDEKTAANQSNVDDTKKSDSSTVKPDDDKEDEQNDSAHNVDSSADNHEDDDKMDDNSGIEDTRKDDVAGNCDAAATTTTTTTTTSSTSSSTSTTTTTVPPASSNGATVASDKESSKSAKDADKDKDKDKNNKGNPGRSLWVTNLLPSTRAQELKHLLSKYGKVIGAKVVQSSRYPRQRCYGYVTMETRAAADLCIEKLTNTELKGQIIRVAKVRPEHSLPIPMNKPPKKEDSVEKDKRKKSPPSTSTKSDRKSPEKKKETTATSASESMEKKKDKTTKKEVKDGKEERNRSRKSSRESTGRKRSLTKSSTTTRVERKSDILTFDKIREERERQRQRERERAMREEEKRRREIARAREIEKRQREEAMRLEREREKLRMERDRLDRQRAEIMRLERERQRLEREKLEQERQELRRAQMKLEEARRPVKRPSSSTTANYRRESGGAYSDDRKRMVTDRHYDETPPPPRFEVTNRDSAPDIPKSKELPKDYKSRLAYSSKRAEEYPPKRSSGSEFKRDYPPADRHSGGHPSHLVHSIGNSASSSKYESSSYVNREREREIREPTRRDTIVPNVPPPRISKDARYAERTGERSPVSYRAVRDEREQRRQVSDHHSSKGEIRSSREHRYPEPSMKEGARYREGGNSWHSTPVKPFSNIGGGGSAASSRDSWNKTDTWRPMEANTNERWGNSSSRMLMSGTSGVPNSIFSGGSSTLGISAGLSCPPPPGNSSYPMDRFESSFKSLNSSRKY